MALLFRLVNYRHLPRIILEYHFEIEGTPTHYKWYDSDHKLHWTFGSHGTPNSTQQSGLDMRSVSFWEGKNHKNKNTVMESTWCHNILQLNMYHHTRLWDCHEYEEYQTFLFICIIPIMFIIITFILLEFDCCLFDFSVLHQRQGKCLSKFWGRL